MLWYWPFFSASSPFYHLPCHNHHPEHCMCSHCVLLLNFQTAGISITPHTHSITQSKTYAIPILPHAPSHLASPRHNTCGCCISPLNMFCFHFIFILHEHSNDPPTPDPHKCDKHHPSVSLLHCHLHFIIFI